MDSEGYIRCEALQTGPAENSLDGNGNVVDYLVSEKRTEIQTSQMSSSHSCPVDVTTTAKNGSLESSRVGSRVSRKMRESLFAQIKDPNCGNFPPKPKLEREQALRSENVFPPKPEDDASRFSIDPRNEADSRHSLFDNFRAGDPEASKLMFEKIIAQMEKPQQNDVSELFPTARPKRNSIGAVSSDTVRDVQQRTTMVPGGKTSHFGHKKHAVIEKTKSTSDGFGAPRALSPGPPPLPLRPDPADMTRRRASSSSIGDLSDEIQRRPEWAAAHRSTFFAKGMRSIDPTTLLLPHKTNIDTSHLTGEAAIQARLLEKTEMRDEQASQRRNSTIEESGSFSCPIPDGGGTDVSAFDSSEKGSCKLSENGEDEGHGEVCKRKDSKASKFVKKVWKLAPKPRRGSNDSREISEEVPEKPRRDSLSPGDAMDIQGRFSGSEPSTPETSPKMSRKASKSSPKSSRKTSREEKLKKDKESPEMSRKSSTASKMLRKVHKGSDAKKDDSTARKASKEESFTDNTVKPLASPNKDKHMKWLPHEKAQKDKRAKSNSESDDMTDAPCQVDGRSEVPSDLTDSQSALSNNTPAPALPPRKKFDPPPLPPRQAKSPTSFSTTPSPVHSSTPHHSGRTSQTAAPPSREGRRHSGQKGMGSILKEEFLPPPPVPPRRENNQSPPDSKKATSERSSARAAPVIQLTCSSPENRQDSAEKQNSDSEEDITNATVDKATEQHPPALSATPQSPDSLSHPVPRRPPKPDGERRTQAKEFFRSHVSQRVCSSPTSDSEPTDLDENDSRYGNIEQIRMATSTSEHQEASLKAAVSSRHDNPETNCTEKPTPGPLTSGASRVIKSQREAMRLKINLMKESSVDEDPSFENDDGGTTNVTSEDVKDESAPRRPSTPLSIQRSPLTLSHISSVTFGDYYNTTVVFSRRNNGAFGKSSLKYEELPILYYPIRS